jgi:hypothetical protein
MTRNPSSYIDIYYTVLYHCDKKWPNIVRAATFVQFLKFEFQIRIIAVPKRRQASLYIRFMSLLVRNHKSSYLFKNSPSLRLWCTYFVHILQGTALQYCAWFQYSDNTVGFNSRRWKNAILVGDLKSDCMFGQHN